MCVVDMLLQKKLPLSVFANSLLELKSHYLFETLGSVELIVFTLLCV